jgi:hypothetical protein
MVSRRRIVLAADQSRENDDVDAREKGQSRALSSSATRPTTAATTTTIEQTWPTTKRESLAATQFYLSLQQQKPTTAPNKIIFL